jgi:hypothetical protein
MLYAVCDRSAVCSIWCVVCSTLIHAVCAVCAAVCGNVRGNVRGSVRLSGCARGNVRLSSGPAVCVECGSEHIFKQIQNEFVSIRINSE